MMLVRQSTTVPKTSKSKALMEVAIAKLSIQYMETVNQRSW
jgi:hypothetical protein